MLQKAQVQVVSVMLITGIALFAVSAAYFWGIPLIHKSQSSTEVSQAKNLMLNLADEIDTVAQRGDQKLLSINVNGDFKVNGDENCIEYKILSETAAVATTGWVPFNDELVPVRRSLHLVKSGGTEIMELRGETCTVRSNCPTSTITISGCSASNTYEAGSTFTISNDNYQVDQINCGANEFAVITGPEKEVTGFLGTHRGGVVIARAEPVGDMYLTTFKLVYRELYNPNTKRGYKINITESGNSIASEGQKKLVISKGEIGSITKSDGSELVITPISVTVS